jgi:hypothetical protein
MFSFFNNNIFNMQGLAAFGMGFNAGSSFLQANPNAINPSIWGGEMIPQQVGMPSVFNTSMPPSADPLMGLPDMDLLNAQGSFSLPFNPADFAPTQLLPPYMQPTGVQGMPNVGQVNNSIYNNPNPVDVSGPSPSKAVNFARQFIGQKNDGGKFSQGQTILKTQKGEEPFPWCATFLGYIHEKSTTNIPQDFIYRSPGHHKAHIKEYKLWGQKNNRYKTIEDARKDNFAGVKPGDILVWDRDFYDEKTKSVKHRGHVGIIESIDVANKKINTIQGNSTGYAVAREAVPFDRATLDGIVSTPAE